MKRGGKPKLLWLQSITCNGNTHSFLNHPDLFSLLSHFELLYHPVLETEHTLQDILAGNVTCDILILEGAFREKGFAKDGIEISSVTEHYAKQAAHIITAGTCATFGGIFKQYDPEHITGFCFDIEEETTRHKQYADKLISLPGCPIHPKWLGFVLMMIAQKRPITKDALHRQLQAGEHGCRYRRHGE